MSMKKGAGFAGNGNARFIDDKKVASRDAAPQQEMEQPPATSSSTTWRLPSPQDVQDTARRKAAKARTGQWS